MLTILADNAFRDEEMPRCYLFDMRLLIRVPEREITHPKFS
jgi:hypothetical protein